MQVIIAKMPRRSINKVVGGQAMTEDIVFSKVQHYVSETSSKGKQDKNNMKNKYCKNKGLSVAKSARKKCTSTCKNCFCCRACRKYIWYRYVKVLKTRSVSHKF